MKKASTYPLPKSFPDHEIGLMTADEFLKHRNPDSVTHSNDQILEQFDKSLHDMNPPDFMYEPISRFRENSILWGIFFGGEHNSYIIYAGEKISAILLKGTLYYDKKFDESDLPVERIKEDAEGYRQPFENLKPVSDIKKIYRKVSIVGEHYERFYSKLVQRVRLKGKQFTVRMDKGKYNNFVVVNEDGYAVAKALHEGYGTTLITVAREYRGMGLGKLVGKFWYKYNPTSISGGFTFSGKRNALKIWRDRVKEFAGRGWYSKLLKEGRIDPKKLKQILLEYKKV